MTAMDTEVLKTVLQPVSDLATATEAYAALVGVAPQTDVKEPAHDVGGGRLVATVTDPDGNVVGLLQDR
jgi:hypothetical protein